MRTSLLFCAVAVLAMVVGPGCGDDDGEADAFLGKMRSCDLLSDGTVNGFEDPDTPEEQCRADCLLAASCDDIAYYVCGSGTLSLDTETCLDACYTTARFECADGSDDIPEDWVCDGMDDCADGSDEVGCPVFTCADGSDTIPEDYVCDYYDDCADGSDEVGCNGFDCADGSDTINPDYVCDFYEQCADGSDEVGCPAGFMCADGSDTINPDWVCDFYNDCADGSDEVGCPGFACADGSRTIPEDWVCDLYDDCDDGSDEAQGCAELTCPL